MTPKQLKSLIKEVISEVKHEYGQLTRAPKRMGGSATKEDDERQEVMLMMQIRSAAYWLKTNPQAKPEDVVCAVDLIVDRIDELIGMHKKMQEVAPKGWEGTVKAMKKHSDIDNPWALAHWMKGKGYKSHK